MSIALSRASIRYGAVSLAAIAALVAAGCGGSGTRAATGSRTSRTASSASRTASSASSTERTRFVRELSEQLKTNGLPADVVSCVAQQSRGLPVASVRELAGSNPPAATKQVADGLLRTCVSQGAGVTWLRAWSTRIIRRHAPTGLPAAYTTCIEQKVNAIAPSRLAAMLFSASTTQSSAEARGRQFGVGLAKHCFTDPAVRPALRSLFVGSVERSLNAGHYSTAFKSCVLGKLRNVPLSEYVRVVTQAGTSDSPGVQLGRDEAEPCIGSGAKP